jgi:hypothetical protein
MINWFTTSWGSATASSLQLTRPDYMPVASHLAMLARLARLSNCRGELVKRFGRRVGVIAFRHRRASRTRGRP